MRCTIGTVAALAALLLIATAFWPESPQAPIPNRLVAQSAATTPALAAAPAPAVSEDDERDIALQVVLDRQIEVQFLETSLEDCLNYIKEYCGQEEGGAAPPRAARYNLNIYIDRSALVDSGIPLDALVSLQLTGFKVRTVLELILENYGLGFTTRDGLVFVTTAEQAKEIRVYNVRDLLADVPEGMMAAGGAGPGMMGGGMGPSGMSGAGRARQMAGAPAGMGGKASMMPGMGGGDAKPQGAVAVAPHETSSLAHVIASTIAPETWTDLGGSGSIIEYNGLLVVKNSQAVHGKVKKLLEIMRQSLNAEPGTASKGIPDVSPRGARSAASS